MGGNISVINPFLPDGAIPITNSSGNVAAATATATIPALPNKTAWLTGYMVTAGGANAAAVVNGTITGIAGGTMTFCYSAALGVGVGSLPLIVTLPVPMPASATNVAIVVSMPTLGVGNTNATICAFGYYV